MAYDQDLMVGSGIAFLILPVVAVLARIWAKYIAVRKLTTDDYFVFVALICAIGCCIVQLLAAISGQLGQHQVLLPDGEPDSQDLRFIVYEQCKFATLLLTPIGFGCTKASFLFFYLQIFGVVKPFRVVTYAMLAIVLAWTLGIFFACLFTCVPVTVFVVQDAIYQHKCINGVALWLAAAATDWIVDITILVMPLPLVMRLQAPVRKRLTTSAMFLMGGLVCGISITRFVYFYKVIQELEVQYNDETYVTSPVFFWTVIEASLSVVAACLPTYGPIISKLSEGCRAPSTRTDIRSSSLARFVARGKAMAFLSKTDVGHESQESDLHVADSTAVVHAHDEKDSLRHSPTRHDSSRISSEETCQSSMA